MRILPLLVRQLLLALAVETGQRRPRRRLYARRLRQTTQERVVVVATVPPHDAPQRRVRLQRRRVHAPPSCLTTDPTPPDHQAPTKTPSGEPPRRYGDAYAKSSNDPATTHSLPAPGTDEYSESPAPATRSRAPSPDPRSSPTAADESTGPAADSDGPSAPHRTPHTPTPRTRRTRQHPVCRSTAHRTGAPRFEADPLPPPKAAPDCNSDPSCPLPCLHSMAATPRRRLPPRAASAVSLVKSRIEALEFDASVVGGEVPVDLGLDPVSGGLPGADFGA